MRAGSSDPTPWWAWALPASAFLLFLTLFWPRPYAIPPGDGLTYYSGARHLATEGRYDTDFDQRPAVPITRHPPLFSIMWGGLLRLELAPATALWLIHAVFLGAMGAAGGAVAYRITRSPAGPLLWTIFSCCWPGGDNWVYWVRPLTESGTAALCVVVCWMAGTALRAADRRAPCWILGASVVAGMSTILKVTGACCLPVVALTSIVLAFRRKGLAAWALVPASAGLMLAPFAFWAWRNWTQFGIVEAGKISHEPALMWALMSSLAEDVAAWVLPSHWIDGVGDMVHPLVIVLPLVLLPVAMTIVAWRRQSWDAALAGGCTSIAFGALLLMMRTNFTEETRYWSALWPTLALSLLAQGSRGPSPNPRLGMNRTVQVLLTLVALYCCARFAAARQHLWHQTWWGFIAQQVYIAGVIVVGAFSMQRLMVIHSCGVEPTPRPSRFTGRRLVILLLSATFTVGIWRLGHPPAPWWSLLPVALVGVIGSWPTGRAAHSTLQRLLLCGMAIGGSWILADWRWNKPAPPLSIELSGVRVELRHDVLRARETIAAGIWPGKFVSNCAEYMIDLFGDHAVLPLPWYANIARFRAGLPQLAVDDARVKSEWLEQLRQAGITDPFVMVVVRQWPARSYCYGPVDFEGSTELIVDWKMRDDDVHIAVCRLSRR